MILLEQSFTLPYTLCFCRAGGKILMLFRQKSPNKYLWNGVGGKIEEGESPEMALAREVMEETGIDLASAKSVHYAGIITWTSVRDSANINKGAYTYIADLNEKNVDWQTRETVEGKLEWKDVRWATDKNNKEIVENLPYILPHIFALQSPVRYHCVYEDGKFKDVTMLLC